MIFKNVEMIGKAISLTRPFNYRRAAVYTVLAGVFMYLLADGMVHGGEINTVLMVLMGVVFLVWVYALARQKTVTTFDPDTGLITRRNLLWALRSIPFDQAGVVTLVSHQETCGPNGEVLCLTRPGNRFGKGIMLTKIYDGADPELVYIRNVVVPALDAMLVVVQTDTSGAQGDNAGRSLPEAPRCYTKIGGVYRRLTLRTLFFPAVITVIMLVYAAVEWNALTAGIGVLFLVVTLLLPCKVELDSDLREVRQYKFLGLRVNRRISFDQFQDILTVREHQNGIYAGTRMEMRFDGVKWTIPLARVFFTGKLDRLFEETENIILADRR
ncbi:MAG: hypothetical protein LIQ31_00665 [Planctomycetes bacterium]|nr:hypothetical protein [Planctomycetota bacterium]